MGQITRKNRWNYRNFDKKASLELIGRYVRLKWLAYTIWFILEKNLAVFRSSPDSSLFHKLVCKFDNFNDYVIVHYVIGHDVIGHPDIWSDNSGPGLCGIENRLVAHGLQKNDGQIRIAWFRPIKNLKNGPKIPSDSLPLTGFWLVLSVVRL